MSEKSMIPYITKSSINCMLLASSVGLIYNYQLDFKQRILLLLQKTSNLSILVYNYYKNILELNKNLYDKFLFFLNENKNYKTYGYISITVIGISSLLYKKYNKFNVFLSNRHNMIYKMITSN
jgi:hypothetical protein